MQAFSALLPGTRWRTQGALSSVLRHQVAYARDVANVTFSVAPAALPMPAAVRYTVTSQTRAAAGDILAGNATAGVLEWREQRGFALNLTLPVRAFPAAHQAGARHCRCRPGICNSVGADAQKAFHITCNSTELVADWSED